MYGKPYRGFESLSLRHTVRIAEKSADFNQGNPAMSPANSRFLLLNAD
jgi:hypothetical protein